MSSSLTDEELATCKAFRAHDFDADEEFQSTYQKLDDQGIAPELLKAQLHFYSSRHTPISLSSYRRYLKPPTSSSSSNNEPSQHDRSSVLTGDEQPPAPIPFQELAALIAEGRIGEVPVMETRDGVVQEEPKEGVLKGEVRLKPWEVGKATETTAKDEVALES